MECLVIDPSAVCDLQSTQVLTRVSMSNTLKQKNSGHEICKQAGVKPIFGKEFCFQVKQHLFTFMSGSVGWFRPSPLLRDLQPGHPLKVRLFTTIGIFHDLPNTANTVTLPKPTSPGARCHVSVFSVGPKQMARHDTTSSIV